MKVLYDGRNGTSVVRFTNLIMFEGRLIYVYTGVLPCACRVLRSAELPSQHSSQ